MPPNVSVLIPIHNAENTLKTALDSLKAQTLPEIEFVCINDGSTDRSAEILQSYAQDPRFKIISLPENQGTFLARKRAVESASGQYIMFLDADDRFEPDACEIAFREIQRHNVQIYHFGTRVESPNLSRRKCREIEESLRPHPGCLKGNDTFLLTGTGEYKYTHTLWNKIFSSALCKEVYRIMPDARIICMEDFFIRVFEAVQITSQAIISDTVNDGFDVSTCATKTSLHEEVYQVSVVSRGLVVGLRHADTKKNPPISERIHWAGVTPLLYQNELTGQSKKVGHSSSWGSTRVRTRRSSETPQAWAPVPQGS